MAALSASNWTDTVVRRPFRFGTTDREALLRSAQQPDQDSPVAGFDNFSSRLGLIWIRRVEAIEKAAEDPVLPGHSSLSEPTDRRPNLYSDHASWWSGSLAGSAEKEANAKESSVFADEAEATLGPNRLSLSCPRLPLSGDHCRENIPAGAFRIPFVVLAFTAIPATKDTVTLSISERSWNSRGGQPSRQSGVIERRWGLRLGATPRCLKRNNACTSEGYQRTQSLQKCFRRLRRI